MQAQNLHDQAQQIIIATIPAHDMQPRGRSFDDAVCVMRCANCNSVKTCYDVFFTPSREVARLREADCRWCIFVAASPTLLTAADYLKDMGRLMQPF